MLDEQNGLAVHEQQEWFRVTLASIGDAVITTDTRGVITYINPIAEELTGWSLNDAAGQLLQSVFTIINESNRRTVENPASRALREGLIVGLANHTLLIDKDGNERPIDDSAAPIRNESGEVVGVVLIFRDVTQRRKAEIALHESEERFRLLVEGTRDYAIFMLDRQGHVSSWNAGAERIKGYKAGEIVGKHFSVFYPQEMIDKHWPETELKAAIAVGRFEDMGWRVRKDGSQFWANVIITALRDDAGNLRGFSKITRDLTERHQLERAKLQTEVMADLNRRKDEFIAMLSHELRNPLAAILNALHLQRLQDDEDPIHSRARSIIERQVENLTRLVDDLLDVSRITTGRIRLKQVNIDLREIADRAVDTVRPLIAQRRHNLNVSVSAEPVLVHADPTRIEQVVANLLGNAIKYTDDGGDITLTVQQEAGDAVLRLRDTGMGIAPDMLPRIFDPFTQSDRSPDRSQGGLGVGLTVVQRIIEMHGGKVAASSAGIGQGAEFMVRLPIAAATIDNTASASGDSMAPPTRVLRVMVVDDNVDTADSTAMLLRRFGHDVRVQYSSKSALAEAPVFRPDVVILDIGLPEMNGYEVARRFRQDPGFPNLRLIALSGYGQDADRKNSSEAGFDEHLIKPAEPHMLLESLRAS